VGDPQGQGNFGTVYFPEPDTAARAGDAVVRPGQIARLPRRRRPWMILIAVMLVGIGILVSVTVYQRVSRQIQVLVVARTIEAGTVVRPADLSTASIAATGVSDIPAGQVNQVTGLTAGSTLHPGALLAPSDLVSSLPPPPGRVLVGLSLRPSAIPAGGLAPGDRVVIVATPGIIGSNGAVGSPNRSLTAPVAGVVQTVDAQPNQDGNVVVGVLVPSSAGPAVLQQDSTTQLGLIVTKTVAP
jgi:hypothetical protein